MLEIYMGKHHIDRINFFYDPSFIILCTRCNFSKLQSAIGKDSIAKKVDRELCFDSAVCQL